MKKRKWLSGILAAVLTVGLLAGCGDGKTGAVVEGLETEQQKNSNEMEDSGKKGRFLETEIALPREVETIYCMGKQENGTISVFAGGEEKDYLFTSWDMGENWETVETNVVSDAWIMGSSIAPDGSAYLAGYYMDIENMEQCAVKRVAPDGTVTDFMLHLPEISEKLPYQDQNLVLQMGIAKTGEMLIQDLNADILEVNTETGECTKKINCEGDVSYFGLAGEKLLLVTDDGIPVYHTADGTEYPADEVLNEIVRSDVSVVQKASDTAYPMLFTEGVEDNSIVYADHNGVYYHRDGGSFAEQLVSGELNSLGDTNISFYSMVMLDETHFLIQITDANGDAKILKYSYDKTVSAVPEKELTLYSLKDSSILRQAVSIYQKQNQDIYVKLEIGMSGEDGITAEDAISALNTEIMAGNAPDVMILDGLPTESYIEKGILADISGVVKQLEETDGLFSNIEECYERDGAYYELPVRFYTSLVYGTPEAVAAGISLETFAEYVEQLQARDPEHARIQSKRANILLWLLYQADSANWRKEDGSLDEERIQKWLTQAKRLYDCDADSEESYEVYMYQNELVGTISIGAVAILTKKADIGYGTIVSLANLVDLLAVAERTGNDYGILNGQEKNSFSSYLKAGISSTSTVTAEAEEFLLTLFGKECGSTAGNGFPINRAGFDALCERGLELYGSESQLSVGMSDGTGEPVEYEMNQLNETVVDSFSAFLESLNAPALEDAAIENIVLTWGENYLKGESSLEETLSDITQKLNLYLAE